MDADFYWHLTAGRLIATDGVQNSDPFSYAWNGAWVMHEWLGEWLLYRVVDALGWTGAAFLFGVVSASGPLVVGAALRRRLAQRPVAGIALAVVVVLFNFTSYATMRPQALSWLLLGILLAGLISVQPHHRRYYALAVPLFALWANTHGLFVSGLGVLGVFTFFTVIGRTPMHTERRLVVAVFVGSVLATAMTPYGLETLLYPLRYVGAGDWGLRYIAEWQSPDFHDAAGIGLLLLLSCVMANRMRATPDWLAALSVLGAVAALLAVRNVPIAALLALPTLSLGFTERIAVRFSAPDTPSLGRRLVELAGASAVVIAAIALVPHSPGITERSVDAAFPVSAVDRLEQLNPDSRVLADYGWGGYVIYRLYGHGGQVFVDGRNDMYPEVVLRDFMVVRNAEEGWRTVLDRYGTDAIVMPPQARIVEAALGAGWCKSYGDSIAVLLVTCAERPGPAARATDRRGIP